MIADSKPKKKRKFSWILVVAITVIAIILLNLRGRLDGLELLVEIGLYILTAIIVAVVEFMRTKVDISSKGSKKFTWSLMFLENFFWYVLMPGMVISIVFIASFSTIYPPASYPNGTFLDNANQSVQRGMSTMSNALSSATMAIVTVFYSLGEDNPYLMFWTSLIVIAVGFYLCFPSKEKVEERMTERRQNEKKKENDRP